jgi:hypothetical protein
MPHQITSYDCPCPPNTAQAMNIDGFAVFEAEVDGMTDAGIDQGGKLFSGYYPF